jgi:hypothetical protein
MVSSIVSAASTYQAVGRAHDQLRAMGVLERGDAALAAGERVFPEQVQRVGPAMAQGLLDLDVAGVRSAHQPPPSWHAVWM